MFKTLQRSHKSVGRAISGYSTKQPQLPPCDYKPSPYTGPSFEEVKSLRQQHLSPAIFTYYKNPIMVHEAKMQYMWDHTGKRYLDCIGGIVTISVGHCHPKVVEAGVNQMKKLMHTTTIYHHSEIAQYAKELADKMPGNLKVCYFVNSGSEANDLAMLMARLYSGNNDIIALRNAYHGMSYNAMGITALSTWKYPTSHGYGVHHALNPNVYRGPFGKDDPNHAEKYAWDVKNIIDHATPGRIAGFIHETIQGVGGTIEMPDGYLPKVYEYVRAAGGVCIADEVQTGFGRTGTHYWGFETKGVIPDIVTMAKGIGNGTPLAAVVTTREIAETLTKRIHFNTYGGNPVSMAIARAVLKSIDEDKCQENSLVVGKKLKDGLLKLQEKYEMVGDVRGKGLMLGMELVKDRKTKTPATQETNQVFERVKDMGLLVGKGGFYGNVFRIKPPMCVNSQDVDFVLDVFDIALKEIH